MVAQTAPTRLVRVQALDLLPLKQVKIMTLKALVSEISEKYVDKFSEQAVKLYKTYSTEEADEFNKELVNLAYDFIEVVMSSVLEFIRLEYGVIGEPLSRKEILKLFYSKDGLSVEDRLASYTTKDLRVFIYDIHRFFTTESIVSANKIFFLKLKKQFEYAKIENLYCCEHCMDTVVKFNDWTPTDEINIEDLPPYHPECVCMLVFSHHKGE